MYNQENEEDPDNDASRDQLLFEGSTVAEAIRKQEEREAKKIQDKIRKEQEEAAKKLAE